MNCGSAVWVGKYCHKTDLPDEGDGVTSGDPTEGDGVTSKDPTEVGDGATSMYGVPIELHLSCYLSTLPT